MNQNGFILAGVALSGLYAITDESLMPAALLLSKAEAALRGGCRILQYRNKNASASEQLQQAQGLRDLCYRYNALFIVNDQLALAQQVGADGVHIGQTDMKLQQARQRLGDKMIIGVSCHNDIELAAQAQTHGASYVAFGRFFPSHTKPDAPAADLAILATAKQQLQVPVVAIGGITRDNASRVIEQGANMVAVIHDLFALDDPVVIEERARFFTQLFS